MYSLFHQTILEYACATANYAQLLHTCYYYYYYFVFFGFQFCENGTILSCFRRRVN